MAGGGGYLIYNYRLRKLPSSFGIAGNFRNDGKHGMSDMDSEIRAIMDQVAELNCSVEVVLRMPFIPFNGFQRGFYTCNVHGQ
ncbi:hypothetical protein NC652_024273 [Populus alba x Populus x berolinensis]|nr:hypothetical protein NC652_024273 [Populus alba x Populus x berolinensis]